MEGFDWKTEDTIKNELRKDFECFDKDKSGFLDQSELKDILTKYGVENLTDEEVAEFLDAIDKNSDGRINLDGSVETFFLYRYVIYKQENGILININISKKITSQVKHQI